MGSRFLRPSLLRDHLRCFSRRLNTAPSPISAVDDTHVTFQEKLQPLPTIEKPPGVAKPDKILDLSDHEKLFASVSTGKLLRATANLHVVGIEPMVDLGMWILTSRLMDVKVVRDMILATVKHTFFEHFCAGESAEEAAQCVRRIHETTGLKGMLFYGVEHTDNNAACDQNLKRFLETVQSAKSLPPPSVSSVIVKITAICPISVLKRVSDLLRWQYKDPFLKLPWKLNTLPIFTDSSPLYHTLQKPEPLTQEEEHQLQLGHERLLKLCQDCLEASIPLMIDAEDTSLQPAIDYMTYSSAILYNKYEMPIIYGTTQAYLKDARERLYLAAKTAEKLGVQMGFKLVRGAYMSSEVKLASSLGYESPVHNSIQETHDCYNDCASFMLENIAKNSGSVVFATHNIESGQLAATKARELGIEKSNERLGFAQLYGMADALSYSLRNAGFRVSKYMSFGPVDMAMPYLVRRAEENRGMLTTAALDRQLMRKELKRRLISGLL